MHAIPHHDQQLLASRRKIKFANDTISWEVCHASGSDSRIQTIIDDAAEWSLNNMIQLNAGETKETLVSFSQKFHPRDLPSLLLEGTEPERITSVKPLEVVISSDLSWASHVDCL